MNNLNPKETKERKKWNLITVKSAAVTLKEFSYYGGIEAALQRKGFPPNVPEDGTILLSWFDPGSNCAYYEIARFGGEEELREYEKKRFNQTEGDCDIVMRVITFPEEE